MRAVSNWLGFLLGRTGEHRLNKGISLAESGEPDQAIRIYDLLIASSGDSELSFRALFRRALAYSMLGDYGQAERDLKSVLGCRHALDGVRASAEEHLSLLQKKHFGSVVDLPVFSNYVFQ